MHYIFIPHAKPNATESQRITPTPAMALAVLWRWQLQAMATTMETRSKHNTRLESERRLTVAAHARFLLEFERALGGLLPFIPSPAAATPAATRRNVALSNKWLRCLAATFGNGGAAAGTPFCWPSFLCATHDKLSLGQTE